jgi:UDP-2,3-diacylglucosamine hydrolase
LILFISDLHLSPRSPGATALFLRFLAGRARQAEALYILGDLFEVWVGDDDRRPVPQRASSPPCAPPAMPG